MLYIYLFMIIFPGFKAELTLLFLLLETPLYVLSIYSGVEIVIPNVLSFVTARTTCKKHYEVLNCVKYKSSMMNPKQLPRQQHFAEVFFGRLLCSVCSYNFSLLFFVTKHVTVEVLYCHHQSRSPQNDKAQLTF